MVSRSWRAGGVLSQHGDGVPVHGDGRVSTQRCSGELVTLAPLHQYGRPVVRAVPTDVVAEQFRAGESTETIADLFDLTAAQVEQALRFELTLARIA